MLCDLQLFWVEYRRKGEPENHLAILRWLFEKCLSQEFLVRQDWTVLPADTDYGLCTYKVRRGKCKCVQNFEEEMDDRPAHEPKYRALAGALINANRVCDDKRRCPILAEFVGVILEDVQDEVEANFETWGTPIEDWATMAVAETPCLPNRKYSRHDPHLQKWLANTSSTENPMNTVGEGNRAANKAGVRINNTCQKEAQVAAIRVETMLRMDDPVNVSLAFDAMVAGNPGQDYAILHCSDLDRSTHTYLPPEEGTELRDVRILL